ncbi:hypothetical protein E8E12_010949 [Didymella heteroderae]|uniref:Uncharacterized protein n=1 Tax=Didymella heteroderae TaxID=1769908 RepID=A0A9P5C4U8_9PLEO|nr:hypothetical protein E8E12_010949 [Didymella heteroderae]
MPTEFDLIHEEWSVNGKLRNIVLPAYASSDTAELTKNLESFVEKCRPAMQKLMTDQISDELSLATFREAIRYASVKDSKLIKLALKVRTTALLSAGWGSLVGVETLGTQRVDGANAGYCGDIPTPVPLSHQFDVVFRNAMHKTEREVVKLLKAKIFHTKPRPWYEIFLTYFIMLTHLQFIHDQAVGFMRIRQQTKSGRRVSVIIEDMVGKWNYSAANMLHHYRCVLNGDLPFRSAERNPELLRRRDNLDDEAMRFIAKAHMLIKRMV